jgi:hypothetical protein
VAKAEEAAKVLLDAPEVRTVTGHVRDRQGRPLAGVRLQVAPDRGAPNPWAVVELGSPVTDREGLFLFPDLPRRPLRISLNRRGYRDQVEDLPADRDEVRWTFELVPDSRDADRPAPVHDEPIPPGLRDHLTFVALDLRGTEYLADGPASGGHDLNRLPRGIHRLGETYFRIGEKMVHLRGHSRPELPQEVKGIEVRARGGVLHFLHATQGSTVPNALIGGYVVHYADGSHQAIPLLYARDLTNWFNVRGTQGPTRAGIAWTGSNDSTDPNRRFEIRLFAMTWTNPHPEREIAALDVLSAGKDCDPFLVAVTVERDR